MGRTTDPGLGLTLVRLGFCFRDFLGTQCPIVFFVPDLVYVRSSPEMKKKKRNRLLLVFSTDVAFSLIFFFFYSTLKGGFDLLLFGTR